MQIKGKIFTIIGIVLLFGYLIKDSLKDPYDPTQVVMVNNDTLGRDWGALAEKIARDRIQIQVENSVAETPSLYANQNNAMINLYGYGIDSNGVYTTLDDPFKRRKFNQENYSSIESPDGREIITDYSRVEETENEITEENTTRKLKTRHQKETNELEEPEMKYRD